MPKIELLIRLKHTSRHARTHTPTHKHKHTHT